MGSVSDPAGKRVAMVAVAPVVSARLLAERLIWMPAGRSSSSLIVKDGGVTAYPAATVPVICKVSSPSAMLSSVVCRAKVGRVALFWLAGMVREVREGAV